LGVIVERIVGVRYPCISRHCEYRGARKKDKSGNNEKWNRNVLKIAASQPLNPIIKKV
jgi:hypothetical protein